MRARRLLDEDNLLLPVVVVIVAMGVLAWRGDDKWPLIALASAFAFYMRQGEINAGKESP